MFHITKTMLDFDKDGISLAGKVHLAKFTGSRKLDIAAAEERILSLLSIAYRGPVSDRIMTTLKQAAAHWNAGREALATLRLTYLGLKEIEDDACWSDLRKAEFAFDAGLIPEGAIFAIVKGYNPDEPRDAQGRWTSGGASSGLPGIDVTDLVSTFASDDDAADEEDDDDSGDDESDPTPENANNTPDETNPQMQPADWRTNIERNGAQPADKQRFVDAHLADAQIIANELGVPVENILGLAALESQWGANDFSYDGNNYFSLHCPDSFADYCVAATGNPNVKVAYFSSFLVGGQAFVYRVKNLGLNGSDPTQFATILQNAGLYGINPLSGTKGSSFVSSTARTITGLRKYIRNRDL